MYGNKSVGVYIKTPNFVRQLNLDFSNKKDTSLTGSTNDWSPMTLYGDNGIGLYIENVDKREKNSADLTRSTGTAASITKASAGEISGKSSVVYGNFAVNIGDDQNNKNQNYTSTNKVDMTNPSTFSINAGSTEGDIHTFKLNNDDEMIEKNYGIFSNYNIDFSDNTVSSKIGINKFGHQVNIFGNTKENVGVLTGNKAEYKLGAGSVNLSGKNSIDNTGIVVGGAKNNATDGTVIGDVVTIKGNAAESADADKSDRGNRAITAVDENNSVTVNAVESNDAINSITLVANNKAKITVNDTASTPTIIGSSGVSTKAGVNISGSIFKYDGTRVKSKTD